MPCDSPAGLSVLLLFTLVLAVLDFRTRTVPLLLFVLFGVFELLWYGYFLYRGIIPDIRQIAGGLLTGLFLTAASFLTGGSVGLGDSLYFLLAGAFLGTRLLVPVLFGTLFPAALLSLLVLTLARFDPKLKKIRTLPLLPFAVPPVLLLFLWRTCRGS